MTKQAKDLFGPTTTVTEEPGGSCQLSPGMMYGQKNNGKIRTWFHMATPLECGNKCRDTPNCAFFVYDGTSTECTLKDLNPAKTLIPANPSITSGACVSLGGSDAAVSAKLPGGAAPAVLGLCPRACWKSAKTWMKVLAVGLTVMGAFVIAVIFLNPAELRSWLMPYSLHGSFAAVALYVLVAFALQGVLVAGSALSIGCSALCATTPLFSSLRVSLMVWFGIGALCCVLMLTLLLQLPHQEADSEPSESTPMVSYEPSKGPQRSVHPTYYYPPQWANAVNAKGQTVKVYNPPHWSPEAPPARLPRR
jgi:hypothetical protein